MLPAAEGLSREQRPQIKARPVLVASKLCVREHRRLELFIGEIRQSEGTIRCGLDTGSVHSICFLETVDGAYLEARGYQSPWNSSSDIICPT